MPLGTETTAIVAVATLGALAEAAVGLRWYEPPERDGETPTPVFEAALFFVSFALVFAVLGLAIVAFAGFAPPLSREVTLVLAPVGLWLSRAALTGRFDTGASDAVERYMGGVAGVVLAVYPVVLFVA